jgi:hypothetical protein
MKRSIPDDYEAVSLAAMTRRGSLLARLNLD